MTEDVIGGPGRAVCFAVAGVGGGERGVVEREVGDLVGLRVSVGEGGALFLGGGEGGMRGGKKLTYFAELI